MRLFREIRGVQGRRRWFQSAFFDLFVTQDRAGEVQWFQLCYARDTWRERVLEWRRGRGFQHMRLLERDDAPLTKDSNALVLDGVMPYLEVMDQFQAARSGLPADIARLVDQKIREFARPARRYRRPGTRTPRWLQRMRERIKVEARLAFLDSAQDER